MINSDELRSLVSLTNSHSQPNINELWMVLRNLNSIRFSVKQDGYRIGREIYRSNILRAKPVVADPNLVLQCKPSTQADIESEWFRFWCDQLHLAPLPHRKLWEYAYVLQNLYALGFLTPGMSGLGFGCGEEPLPSFFASKGIQTTVTDLAPDLVEGMGWAETGQHTSNLEKSFVADLVEKNQFDRLVELQFVDMNHIPSSLSNKYDFCWSICALEHLGSIRAGLEFIKNSLSCLKPGGVALHTTEFNFSSFDETVDNWQTVLFLRKHFLELADEVRRHGHEIQAMDFNVGFGPLDSFVDLPPFEDRNCPLTEFFLDPDLPDFRPGHLKLSVNGFPSTCFGLTIRRAL